MTQPQVTQPPVTQPPVTQPLAAAAVGAPGPLGDAVRAAAARLAAAGVASARVDAELLAGHATGRSRSEVTRAVLTGADLAAADAVALDELVARRADRVPLQHLTGTAAFRHVELSVGPGVFVPRPETELLAGWAVEAARASLAETGTALVVDLGTGSGAIAAAVADEVPAARVVAVELDPAAWAWAARNLAGGSVELLLGDATVLDVLRPDLAGAVDVVVTNPPYIPLDAWESVAPEVRDHDPALALWGGDDGLAVVRGVAACAARLLRPGGVVGIEHADAQGAAVPAVLAAAGSWSSVRDHPDLAGRPRYTTAQAPRTGAGLTAGEPGSATMSR